MNRVTFIICNHNYGKYLDRAIFSAKNQTYPVTQICVIDDSSSDNSLEIAKKSLFCGVPQENTYPDGVKTWVAIEDSHKYLLISLPKQSGPSLARNIGIHTSWSESECFAILDADDENYSTKIEKCVKVLDEDKNIGVVYADYHIFNVETGLTTTEFKEPYSKHRLSQECIVHSGAVIRKEALEKTKDKNGFYDTTLRVAEDFDLWLRISDHYLIHHIAEPLSLVRVHKANSTFSVDNQIWQQNWRRIQEKRNAKIQ